MERHFDEALEELHKEIFKMGVMVEETIAKSMKALKNRSRTEAEEVIANDSKIDLFENDIDERCIDLIARHQPMARDLRTITTAMKINSDLERIADLSVDICQRILDLAGKPELKALVDIPELASLAQSMLRDAIDSYIKQNVELARKVVLTDPQADLLRNKVQQELINDFMVRDGSTADRAVPLLLIGRHLERICDHTTNIAEDVIYMVEAKVVKHHTDDLK